MPAPHPFAVFAQLRLGRHERRRSPRRLPTRRPTDPRTYGLRG